ncbi:hypothetical protein [Kutzneria sp. NPDC052558]|uniref:hypothetical protein n=1 Tax=Kutzneria sp. NPDC052558 TaxID=3364121 RepID=UPI0037C8E484
MLMLKGMMVVAASAAVLVSGASAQAQPSHAALDAAHHQPVVSAGMAGAPRAVLEPPPPELVHTCFVINDDGVRIHVTFDLSSAVVGLAYKGDLFQVPNFPGGGLLEGTDLRTGVHGWIRDIYADRRFLHC